MLIDVHVHTKASPGGKYSLQQLVDRAYAKGLDGLCVTDLCLVRPALEELGRIDLPESFVVLVGFEAHTDAGHFLVFVPEPQQLPELDTWLRYAGPGKVAYQSLHGAVEELGGILVAAHPYDLESEESPKDRLLKTSGISAIEVLNGRRNDLSNELAEELAASLGLAGLGGSDTVDRLDRIGKVATLVLGPVSNEEQFIRMVLQKDAWAVRIGRGAGTGRRSRPRQARKGGAARKKGGDRKGRGAASSAGSRSRPGRGGRKTTSQRGQRRRGGGKNRND